MSACGDHGTKRTERMRKSGGFLLVSGVDGIGPESKNQFLRALEQHRSSPRSVSDSMQKEDGLGSFSSRTRQQLPLFSRGNLQKNGKDKAAEGGEEFYDSWHDSASIGKGELDEVEDRLLRNTSQADPANIVSLVQNMATSRDAHPDPRLRHGIRNISVEVDNTAPMSHPQGAMLPKQRVLSTSRGHSTASSAFLGNPLFHVPAPTEYPSSPVSPKDSAPKSPFRFEQPGPKITVYASEGTMARVAKAKQYLELKYHYIKLMAALPKDETNNFMRHYNPLQTLRNRRIRNRLGLGSPDLTPWEEPDAVYQWMLTCLDTLSKSPRLAESDNSNNTSSMAKYPHLPSPPCISYPVEARPKNKPKRSRIIQPAELFADFYWIEELGGKVYVEDREGRKIYRSTSETSKAREKRSIVVTSGASHGAAMPHDQGVMGVNRGGHHSGQGRRGNRQHRLGSLWPHHDELQRFGSKGHNGRLQSERSLSLSDSGRRGSRESIAVHGLEHGTTNFEDSIHVPGFMQKHVLGASSGLGISIGIGGGNISPDMSSAEDSDNCSRKQFVEAPHRNSMDLTNHPMLVDETKSLNPNSNVHSRKSSDIPSRRHVLNMDSQILDQRRKRDRYEPFSHHQTKHLRRRRRRRGEAVEQVPSSVGSDTDRSELPETDEEGMHHKKQPSVVAIPKAIGNKLKSNITKGRDKLMGRSIADPGERDDDDEPLENQYSLTKHQRNYEVDDDEDNYGSYESVNVTRSATPMYYEYTLHESPHMSMDLLANSSTGMVSLKQIRNTNQLQPNDVKHGFSRTPSPGFVRTSIDSSERGRSRKSSKDDPDNIGRILRRKMSPTKRLFGRRDSNQSLESEKLEYGSDGSRKADANREEDGERKGAYKSKDAFRKAKEKVGNRVERIKHEVGDFLWGAQSLPSSTCASSAGSVGATEDEAEIEEVGRKNQKERQSLDIENIPKTSKWSSRHREIFSTSNLPPTDLLQSREPMRRNSKARSETSSKGEAGTPQYQHNSKTRADVPVTDISRDVGRDVSPLGVPTFENIREWKRGQLKQKREGSRLAEEYKGEDGGDDSQRISKDRGKERRQETPAQLAGSSMNRLQGDSRDKTTLKSLTGETNLPPVYILRNQAVHVSGKRDIVRARALLLSSSLLAHAIARSQTEDSNVNIRYHRQTLRSQSIYARANRASHTCRVLSKQTNSTLSILSNKIDTFSGVIVPSFHTEIANFSKEISQKLTPLVQQIADEADELNTELSTTHVLNVKRLNDELSQLMRKRRRTALKWVRRGGFVLLEWVVLGVMWWVWLVVVVIRLIRGCLRGVWRAIRWVLWM